MSMSLSSRYTCQISLASSYFPASSSYLFVDLLSFQINLQRFLRVTVFRQEVQVLLLLEYDMMTHLILINIKKLNSLKGV